jgi:Putative amidase domain
MKKFNVLESIGGGLKITQLIIITTIFIVAISCKDALNVKTIEGRQETKEIENALQKYFGVKNDLVINGSTPKEVELFKKLHLNDVGARKTVFEQAELSNNHEVAESVVLEANTIFNLDSLAKIGDNKAVATVSTITKSNNGATDNVTGEPISTEEASVFKINLFKGVNGWLIENEELLSKLGETKTKNTLIKTINFPANSNARTQAGYYFRNSAAQFARDYALKNVDCSDYYLIRGGDCTNFISTCLIAGAWSMDNTWWFKNYCNGSYAWAGANPFKNYMMGSSRRHAYTPTIGSLQVGDIICFEWNGDSSYDHTTMVTKKDSKGNIYLSYHTANTLNILYNDFIKRVISQRGRTPTLTPFKLKNSY